MRLLVYSDLHLEVKPFAPPRTGADLIVLAGDIHNGAAGIAWARANFSVPVLYVPGNHEYYEGEYHAVRAELHAAAHATGIRLLDPGEAVIGGVRFLGCTLWTDYSLASPQARPKAIEHARRRNPDHLLIRFGERALAPEDAIAMCAAQRSWLAARLDQPGGLPTVVITHFAPHVGSLAPAYIGHPANPGFIVPLDEMMGRAALWIHGHTHTAFDYRVRGTRIVCNPRGYPDEMTGFDPLRLIDAA
ncbi:MAG: metallophosphoesterase [Burkholderiales bacterium]|nr:metallophosphoesterase [Burkholderiales bacterium]